MSRHHGKPAWVVAAIAFPGLSYIALILSFLGGMWWWVAASRIEPERLWSWLAAAVVPTLVAFAAFSDVWSMPEPRARFTATVLAAALIISLSGDWRLSRKALVPSWWMGLRVPLSCGLAAEAVLIAALA